MSRRDSYIDRLDQQDPRTLHVTPPHPRPGETMTWLDDPAEDETVDAAYELNNDEDEDDLDEDDDDLDDLDDEDYEAESEAANSGDDDEDLDDESFEDDDEGVGGSDDLDDEE